MKIINIRQIYPFYTSDCFCDVSDEIAEQLRQYDQQDHADYERRRIHKAYYSLDVNDGIEDEIVLLVLSPEEIYERKLSNQELYAAINSLPEKQAHRIYAYFFLGINKTEIARIEGVSKTAVTHSIKQGLKSMGKFLDGFSREG